MVVEEVLGTSDTVVMVVHHHLDHIYQQVVDTVLIEITNTQVD